MHPRIFCALLFAGALNCEAPVDVPGPALAIDPAQGLPQGHLDETQTREADETSTTQVDATSIPSALSCGLSCDLLDPTCPNHQHCVPYVCGPLDGHWGTPICAGIGQLPLGSVCEDAWIGDAHDHCAKELICWNGRCHHACKAQGGQAICDTDKEVCLEASDESLAVRRPRRSVQYSLRR